MQVCWNKSFLRVISILIQLQQLIVKVALQNTSQSVLFIHSMLKAEYNLEYSLEYFCLSQSLLFQQILLEMSAKGPKGPS